MKSFLYLVLFTYSIYGADKSLGIDWKSVKWNSCSDKHLSTKEDSSHVLFEGESIDFSEKTEEDIISAVLIENKIIAVGDAVYIYDINDKSIKELSFPSNHFYTYVSDIFTSCDGQYLKMTFDKMVVLYWDINKSRYINKSLDVKGSYGVKLFENSDIIVTSFLPEAITNQIFLYLGVNIAFKVSKKLNAFIISEALKNKLLSSENWSILKDRLILKSTLIDNPGVVKINVFEKNNIVHIISNGSKFNMTICSNNGIEVSQYISMLDENYSSAEDKSFKVSSKSSILASAKCNNSKLVAKINENNRKAILNIYKEAECIQTQEIFEEDHLYEQKINLRFSNDDQYLFASCGKKLKVLKLYYNGDYNIFKQLNIEDTIESICCGKTGQPVISTKTLLKVYKNCDFEEERLSIDSDEEILKTIISDDSRYLIYSFKKDNQYYIKVHDIKLNRSTKITTNSFNIFRLSTDSSLLVVASRNSIKLYDLKTFKLITRLIPIDEGSIDFVYLSRNEKALYALSKKAEGLKLITYHYPQIN